MSKTTTISCRVPVDVAEAFTKSVKAKGITRSQAMSDLICQPSSVPMELGGVLDDESNEVLNTIAGIAGGVLIGTTVHKLLRMYLPKDKFTEDEINMWANILGMSAAVLGGMGINKLMKE